MRERAPAPLPPDISVSMKPGQMALARTPRGPYSIAADLVNEITPALVAEYTLVPIAAFIPPIDDQFRITPPPVETRALAPCLVPSITPCRLTAMIR